MSELPPYNENPYEHSGPIKSEEYFVGREDELEKIRYDISQGINSDNVPNVGITGKEGAGKSSLTYQIVNMSKNNPFIAPRVTLDSGDVDTEISFFKQLLDEVTSEIGSTVRESFIDWISGATDQVEVNLKFARIYMSSSSNTQQGEVVDSIIKDDLENIYKKSGTDLITIILDNAQELSNNKVILQKLKNIFTEIEGYMLVLSGTDNTFFDISSAFSPIPRSFNRYHIDRFKSIYTTKKAIIHPLSEKERELVDSSTVADIHQLTGGRPYEINLLASSMYKMYDIGETDSLKLSPEVIDTALQNLKDWRRSVDSHLPTEIDTLDTTDLNTLISIIEMEGIDKEDLVNYSALRSWSNAPNSSLQEVKQNTKASIASLLDNGFLNESGGISFSGDLYSLAYLKYHTLHADEVSPLGIVSGEEHTKWIPNVYLIITKQIVDTLPECHTHFYPDDGGF